MLNGTSVKPFLKWAGGKAQLLHELAKLCPNNIRKYYEPFLEGLKTIFLSDNNPELINLRLSPKVYCHIKRNEKYGVIFAPK